MVRCYIDEDYCKTYMQNTDDLLAKLAHGFFEGTLSYDEEQMLFVILREDDECRARFDAMEQAWSGGHVPSAAVEGEWRNVWCRILGGSPVCMKPRGMRLYYRLAAAAVALVLVSSLVTYFFSSRGSGRETYYACMAPLGGKAEVALPDGSRVWLNAGSYLRYPASFGGDNRTVELNGEAYFEVAKHEGVKFTVKTKGYDVIVHGTKFNISAYDDDATVTTTLLEGSVQVNLGHKRVMMVPGEKLALNRASGKLVKTKVSAKASTWIQGNTEYESITLANLVKVLSRRFDMNISVQSPSLRDEQLAISLNNGEDFDGIMRGLQRIIPIRIVRHGKNVQILRR